MDRLQSSFMSIDQIKDTYLNDGKIANRQITENEQRLSFQQILLEEASRKDADVQEVTFSKHANDRLASRNINLNEEQLDRLNK